MSSSSDEQGSNDLVKLLRVKMLNKLGYIGELGKDETREDRSAHIQQAFAEVLAEEGITLPADERRLLLLRVIAVDPWASHGLEALLMDDRIHDIAVVGSNQVLVRRDDNEQFESAHGKFFDDEDHLLRIISRILIPLGHHLDADTPCAQVETPDGSHVWALLDTLGTNRSVLIIQKAAPQPKKGGQHPNLLRKKDGTSKA